MTVDPSPANNARSLLSLTAGAPLPKLCCSSRAIPSLKNLRFFYNLDEFKVPVYKISKESQHMLGAVGSSAHIWSREIAFSSNDPDGSAEDFQEMEKKEEGNGKRVMESESDSDSDWEYWDEIFGEESEKKKNKGASSSGSAGGAAVAGRDWSAVKAATRAKQKVPFHIPTIRKPQEEFNISVNNSNQPFNHSGLKKSEDGKRFIHPLEKLSVSDFVDKDIGDVEPIKPLLLECTPFKHIEQVKDLKDLAAKLRDVNEFAVDLEHNQYRSFQGLTCLMQISTRTEDFVVDTLKLRDHIGPHLRAFFKDSSKKKVMHGADRDIIWLQRDFGIYVCNLFDTGQASRVLNLERKSLEYLLHHFCGVTANKQYQNADWRLRPLPVEMVRYAREDTHYLLYIYDLMKIQLSSMLQEPGNADAPLLDVYKRSYDICMHLYEKELLTEDSFLSIYGLPGAGLNAQQLAIVAGLYEWRDAVARAEDESTGYILPNKILLEIAKQMPVTTNKLRQLVKSKNWYIERDPTSVVEVIRRSMLSAAAFEAAAEQLRQKHLETVAKEKALLVKDKHEVDPHDSANAMDENIEPLDFKCSTSEPAKDRKEGSSKRPHVNGQVKIKPGNYISKHPAGVLTGSVQSHNSSTSASSIHSTNVINGTTGQMLKKPSRSFTGALLGCAAKRKFDADMKDEEEIKLEQTRRSATHFAHPSLSNSKEDCLNQDGPSRAVENMYYKEPSSVPISNTNGKDIIVLDDDSDMEDSDSEIKNEQREQNPQGAASEWDEEDEDEPVSELQEGTSRGMDTVHPERPTLSVASTSPVEIIMINDDSDTGDD